jgi:hypothetical protein
MTMLAYRRTWHIKLGRMDQARELIQEPVDSFKERGFIGRAYASHIGPADVIIWEEDWESEADHDAAWEEIRDAPGTQDWFSRWYEVAERGGTQEIWRLQA